MVAMSRNQEKLRIVLRRLRDGPGPNLAEGGPWEENMGKTNGFCLFSRGLGGGGQRKTSLRLRGRRQWELGGEKKRAPGREIRLG